MHYRRIDVRDTELLNSVIEAIANDEGRMDGLVAAAGIQQETPALEYSAKDSNTMFEVNVTGVFMTSQAVAKQMIRFGNGGSIAMIASMSGTVANRVRSHLPFSLSYPFALEHFPFSFFFLLATLPYDRPQQLPQSSEVSAQSKGLLFPCSDYISSRLLPRFCTTYAALIRTDLTFSPRV